MLAEHLDWTESLGWAFSVQDADVAAVIQMLRAKAESAGNLKSTPEQAVTTREESGSRVIYIAPTNPERIYVPVYDSSVVFDTVVTGALVFGTAVLVGSAWNNRWGWNNRNWNQVWVRPPGPGWRPPVRPIRPPPGAWRPGGPSRPGIRPDRPGVRPDRAWRTSRRPGVRPDRPGVRPDRPGDRPSLPGTGLPGNRPERPGSRPDRPGKRPGRPDVRPERPAARPERPTNRPSRPERVHSVPYRVPKLGPPDLATGARPSVLHRPAARKLSTPVTAEAGLHSAHRYSGPRTTVRMYSARRPIDPDRSGAHGHIRNGRARKEAATSGNKQGLSYSQSIKLPVRIPGRARKRSTPRDLPAPVSQPRSTRPG